MANPKKTSKAHIGQSPGAGGYTGTRTGKSFLRITSFNAEEIKEWTTDQPIRPEELPEGMLHWVDFVGVHDVEKVREMAESFHLHPMMVEDILNVEQRPKLDTHETHHYVVLKMARILLEEAEIQLEQVSFAMGKNFVLSFQEEATDTFDPVRERLQKKARIRQRGPEYLLYALIDTIVDHYFYVLEHFGNALEDLEEQLMEDSSRDSLMQLYHLKREMVSMRRAVWPLREVIGQLDRGDSNLTNKSTKVYFRDLYDHIIQVIDTVETYRDLLSGMVDLYQSTVSNRMNSIMKVLTIISTVFIPITFLTGVYGMNFGYMPLLNDPDGFWIIAALIMVSAIAMLIYFRRQKWM
jgi:magnesium transporter